MEIFSAGYYVVRILDRPKGVDEGLPDQLLTLSSCLTEFFPNAWALDWASYSLDERCAAAAKIGLSEASLPAIVEQITSEFSSGRLGWPCVWYSVNDAKAAAHRAGLSIGDFALVELGVPADFAESLISEFEPEGTQGAIGFHSALTARRPVQTGGKVVGWEVLGAEVGGDFHSWLCNSLQDDALRLGVEPRALGLLATEGDARKVVDMIHSGVGAEPVPWFPALLRQHAWAD